jgi:hypothetical protein
MAQFLANSSRCLEMAILAIIFGSKQPILVTIVAPRVR